MIKFNQINNLSGGGGEAILARIVNHAFRQAQYVLLILYLLFIFRHFKNNL